MKELPLNFYDRDDVVLIAKELIGKVVETTIEGFITSGRIVETEAYVALTDRASHAYNGRRTSKNEHMYHAPGTSYIYICYGMHQMLNIVTNKEGIPDAVLIRAIEPLSGIETMLKRTGKKIADNTLTRGPGNVGKALGINKTHSGFLLNRQIRIYKDRHSAIPGEKIGISRRIGVESAGEDALLPYRFFVKGNPYVSGNKSSLR